MNKEPAITFHQSTRQPGNDVISVHLVHVSVQQFQDDVLLFEVLGQFLRVDFFRDEDEDGADGGEFDDVFGQPLPLHGGLLHHQHVLLHVLVGFTHRITLPRKSDFHVGFVIPRKHSIRILFY